MNSRIDVSGAKRIRDRLDRLANPEMEIRDLLDHWGTILLEDNRRRGLAGLDCNDQAMIPTLREMSLGQLHKQLAGLQTKLKIATGTGKQMRKEMLAGYGQQLKDLRKSRNVFAKAKDRKQVALHEQKIERTKRQSMAKESVFNQGEKRAAQIKREIARRGQSPRLAQGSGPPLAPNREASRSIALFTLDTPRRESLHSWVIEGGWNNFMSRKGGHILGYHRRGIRSRRGILVRDVSSKPTPTAVKRARLGLRDWVRNIMRRV
jgi:hypothetical protein